MTPVMQEVLVFAIVALAMASVAIRFLPKTWRARLASTIAAWTVGVGVSAPAARRIEAKLASGGTCGSCDSCRACATPPAVEEIPTRRIIPIARART